MIPAPDQSNNKNLGCLASGVIGALVLSIAMCSKNENATSNLADENGVEVASTNGDGPPEPASPFPLDASAVKRGAAQMRLIAGLGVSGAAKIFSQNCYEALGSPFDWHQLDRCGGFDAVARRWAEDTMAVTPEEIDWFGPETAATRYLTSATSNGLPAGDADVRWEAIGSATRKFAFRKNSSAPSSKVKTPAAVPESETISDHGVMPTELPSPD